LGAAWRCTTEARVSVPFVRLHHRKGRPKRSGRRVARTRPFSSSAAPGRGNQANECDLWRRRAEQAPLPAPFEDGTTSLQEGAAFRRAAREPWAGAGGGGGGGRGPPAPPRRRALAQFTTSQPTWAVFGAVPVPGALFRTSLILPVAVSGT